jgi:AcrR family transcriptional regulator
MVSNTGSKQRREREKGEMRTRILDAARELFAKDGYEAVTMRKIAERIEYTPTALYFHFKDKEDLMHELCREDFQTFATHFQKALTVSEPMARLRKAGEVYAEFAMTHPNHYRLMFMTGGVEPDEEDRERMGDPGQDAYALLKGLVQDAIDRGALRPDVKDAELVAQILWAGIHGVVSLEITEGKNDWLDWRPFEKRARLMLDVLTDYFAARPKDGKGPKGKKAEKR